MKNLLLVLALLFVSQPPQKKTLAEIYTELSEIQASIDELTAQKAALTVSA